ncbi:helix-turn-helix domain-containing protein [Pseudarcicella hirudinis]
MCEAGTFRWDLYYRLSVVELSLPMLQERGITEKRNFIDFFLEKIQKEMKKPKRLKLSNEVYQKLIDYPFKGNVRELENVMTNLYVFCDKEVQLQDLPRKILHKSGNNRSSFSLKETEKDLIIKALTFYKGNQAKACEAIGYRSINTFKSKIKEYEIEIG